MSIRGQDAKWLNYSVQGPKSPPVADLGRIAETGKMKKPNPVLTVRYGS
jgi:hypothetical protein